jgi:hypothetical protein
VIVFSWADEGECIERSKCIPGYVIGQQNGTGSSRALCRAAACLPHPRIGPIACLLFTRRYIEALTKVSVVATPVQIDPETGKQLTWNNVWHR